jgi:hypothetical protein
MQQPEPEPDRLNPEPEPELPPGWTSLASTNYPGRLFYVHQLSGYTQWTVPTPADLVKLEAAGALAPASAAGSAASGTAASGAGGVGTGDDSAEAFEEPSQEQRNGDGALLVGCRVRVEGMGAGTVVAFRKKMGFGSSAHEVVFDGSLDQQPHTVKLRRKTNTDPEKKRWWIGSRSPPAPEVTAAGDRASEVSTRATGSS